MVRFAASPPEEFALARQRLLAMVEQDPQLRAAIPDPQVSDAICRPGATEVEIVDVILSSYRDRPALCSRSYTIVPNVESGMDERAFGESFDALTYGDLRDRAVSLADAWQHDDDTRLQSGDFVAILGSTSADYVICEIAAIYANAVSVPLQPNLPEADMRGILEDCQPAVLVVTAEHLERIAALAASLPFVRQVVVMDFDVAVTAEARAYAAACNILERGAHRIAVARLNDLVVAKEGAPSCPVEAGDGNRIAHLIYTSGSTGSPKGAIITDRTAAALWTGLTAPIGDTPVIVLAFLPLNHIGGRNVAWSTLAHGGTIYFTAKSDMSTLIDDIRLARPTTIQFIPRVAEMIHQQFQIDVMSRVEGGQDREEAEREVMEHMRATFLGDRLVRGSIGTAPTSPEIKAFLQKCFAIAFTEGYGTTESGGVITVGGRIVRRFITDYKLSSVPELGYSTEDKPYPRGELLVRSRIQIPGYYNRPEASASILDEDGFQRTGDIVEERGPDMVFWIDRRNNVLKLSQGEFVAISALEAVFEGADPLIRQIYIHGESHRSYLLAVVVPDMALATSRLGHEPDEAELRAMVRQALQSAGKAEGLRGFEIPRDVLIETQPFSFENGLLSSVRKPLRPKLKARYEERLLDLYARIDGALRDDLSAVRTGHDGQTLVDRVALAMKASLGLGEPPAADVSYSELGGDSLSAVAFSLLINEVFDVDITAATILRPDATPDGLAALIERRRREGELGATLFHRVHGTDPDAVHTADLKLEAFVDRARIQAAGSLPEPSGPPVVLLTGATGFLGRFLCLNWMEKLRGTGGKVICIVRAADDQRARDKVFAAIGNADPLLRSRFAQLAEDHLEVLAGELSEPGLGLADGQFVRLSREATRVVHCAALVNHRLSYRDLFEPNVQGTAGLIELAITASRKPFDYVSTVAVTNLLGKDADEAKLPDSIAQASLKERYAGGYGVSKWAGELLLLDAHRLCGLEVNVFRPDMIMPHASYRGQINETDMITRLLFSIVTTGLAPRSFYRETGTSGRKPHYNGLPVDVLAQAMVDIAQRPDDGFNIYHTINANFDDGISLDSFVDWIQSARYPVERIADHGEWFSKMQTALEHLPPDLRRRSSLDILGAFANPHEPGSGAYPSERFRAAVTVASGPGGIPHLSEGYIHKYLGDMVQLGLIPAARGDGGNAVVPRAATQ